jgi:hypothetical protein
MYVSNGEEPEGPVKFLPAGANVAGVTVTDNVAYAATTNGCGGAPNALWALDIASKQVSSWQAPSAIAGSDGAAFGPDGVLYVTTTGGELAALDAKTLKVRDIHKSSQPFTTSPVVFQYKEQVMVAAGTKDGHIYIVDTAKLSGPAMQSAVVAPEFSTGALASWQDSAGTRFILAPTPTAIVAVKVGDSNIEQAWSREIATPVTPLVINGVVFAATGATSARSAPSVLYALDGATGAPLWNSGKTITSFVHGAALSGGGSQVYLGTHDGTFWAFGYPIEH